MVLCEEKLGRVSEIRINSFKFLEQQALQKELFSQPHGHCLGKRRKAARRKCKIGFKEPFKLQERLVIINNMVNFGKAQAAGR